MEWTKKMNETVRYIEEHLQRYQEPVKPEEIERIAGCSYDFFQKVFRYVNGISLAEYIRNRKMTLAGYDLKSSDIKVVDLSYKYGYDSPTSFTRAFQSFHGVTPKEAKQEETELEVYPRMNFEYDNEIKWHLEKKQGFRLLGVCKEISCKNGENYKLIPEFWTETMQNGQYAKLFELNQESSIKGIVGLCLEFHEAEESLTYAIGTFTEAEPFAEYEEILIPEADWAVFECVGAMPEAIQRGWTYLNEEWVVKYPFRHAPVPEIEWYSPGNPLAGDYKSEIWIPIEMEEV